MESTSTIQADLSTDNAGPHGSTPLSDEVAAILAEMQKREEAQLTQMEAQAQRANYIPAGTPLDGAYQQMASSQKRLPGQNYIPGTEADDPAYWAKKRRRKLANQCWDVAQARFALDEKDKGTWQSKFNRAANKSLSKAAAGEKVTVLEALTEAEWLLSEPENVVQSALEATPPPESSSAQPAKRKRGRPRKNDLRGN